LSTFDLQSFLSALSPADMMGAAGVALGSTWALFRQRRTILTCQALGSIAFCLHYVLLGSGTAAISCTMTVVQSIAGYSGRRPPWLGPLYVGTYAVVLCGAFFTWHGLPSVFVAIAAGFAAFGRWQTSAQRMRLVFLFCSANWVMHNSLVGSVFGLTSDTIALSTISYGLWRNRTVGPIEAIRQAAASCAETLRAAVTMGLGAPRLLARAVSAR
jgi:Bacterial inner membrane protein